MFNLHSNEAQAERWGCYRWYWGVEVVGHKIRISLNRHGYRVVDSETLLAGDNISRLHRVENISDLLWQGDLALSEWEGYGKTRQTNRIGGFSVRGMQSLTVQKFHSSRWEMAGGQMLSA